MLCYILKHVKCLWLNHGSSAEQHIQSTYTVDQFFLSIGGSWEEGGLFYTVTEITSRLLFGK